MPREPSPESESESDDAALAALFRKERSGLIKLGVLLTGQREAAEDLVQDAFVALQSRWPNLVDKSSVGGYLRMSVLNGARSRFRRAEVARRYLRLAEPTISPGVDAAVLLADEHLAVITEVQKLPIRQRQVLVLRYWLHLTETEIAETMGIASGTVKSTASRALRTLERRLGG